MIDITAEIWPLEPPSLHLSIDRKSELAKKRDKIDIFYHFFYEYMRNGIFVEGGGKGGSQDAPHFFASSLFRSIER